MELTVSFQRDYTSQKGNPTFVYVVDGSKEALAKYKELQGNFHRTDDTVGSPTFGKPLWFTTRGIGARGKLIITTNNKIVPDLSKFRMMESMAKQFGGNLGQAMANQAATELFGSVGVTSNVSAPVAENATAEHVEAESDINKL
jgi:hypothetical protein